MLILNCELQPGSVFFAVSGLRFHSTKKPKVSSCCPPGKEQEEEGGGGRSLGTGEKVLTSGTTVTYEKWRLTGKTAGGRDERKYINSSETVAHSRRGSGEVSGRSLGIPG